MRLNWDNVRSEHVREACELTRSGRRPARTPAKGLVLRYEGAVLPAKHVLRLAYCLAKGLPLDSGIKFTSGDSTLQRLRSLGFDAYRQAAAV